MRKNDRLTLTCERIGADMEGVCFAEDTAVFVPGMLPGERAQVQIVKVQQRVAFGRMTSPPEVPSPDRRGPDCAAWPRCGGCTARHMSYAATLAAKREQVAGCFRRIGRLDVPVRPVIGMDDPARYRNKTALPVGGTAENPVIGFYAPRSHTIIPAADCPNAMLPAPALCHALLDWIRSSGAAPYDEAAHAGLVRHLVVRVSRAGEAMAVIVANGARLPDEAGLVRRMTAAGAKSVILNVNRARTNVILGPDCRTLAGPDTLTDTLCGLTFEISPAAFFQVNPVQTERLYRTALDMAELRPGDLLADVYCGAGTITLMMARHCARAVGIEIVPEAVANARANAARNGVANADFHCGAAEDVLPDLVSRGLRPDVIVVDPPRKGLDPAVIRAMAEAGPRRIVYVSCNPATLARDAALLAGAGYLPGEAQPVDMFCWTSGVETVCAFCPGSGDRSLTGTIREWLMGSARELPGRKINEKPVRAFLKGRAGLCYNGKKKRHFPGGTKMKRIAVYRWVLAVVLVLSCLTVQAAGLASGFSSDEDAIEKAANSVLKLELYDYKGTLTATGSGFIAFDSKTLITNYHVIEDGSYVMAITDDEQKFRIDTVLCSHRGLDIAILRANTDTGLDPLPLYGKEDQKRGAPVVAIGSPKGLKNTVSTGNISSFYSQAIFYSDVVPYIQITAPISPGSSGGALFDDDGRVIAVTSAVRNDAQNINLCIRIKVAQALYNSWDGNTHTISGAPLASRCDYSTIREEDDAHAAARLPDNAHWTCPDCQTENTTLFCQGCGHTRPDWVCQCGEPNVSRFCGKCGSSLADQIARFDEAETYLSNGDYAEAVEIFESLAAFDSGANQTTLGFNSNAAESVKRAYYRLAEELLAQRNYALASEAFKKAGDYVDAPSRVNEPYFAQGNAEMAVKNYLAAANAFLKADNYPGAANSARKAYYFYAEQLLAAGEYEDASSYFTKAKGYSDAASRVNEPYYVQGQAALKDKRYGQAIQAFGKAGSFKDAKTLRKQAYYLYGKTLLEKGEYDKAITNFKNAGDYEDAAQKLEDSIYKKGVALGDKGDYDKAISVLEPIKSRKGVTTKIRTYAYQSGLKSLKASKWDAAIKMFKKAGPYEDAAAQLKKAYNSKMNALVKSGKYDSAYSVYTAAKKDKVTLSDPVVVKPGDKTSAAVTMLKVARNMGFISKLPANESAYKNSYKADMIRMEKAFRLTADGTLHLSEYVTLRKVFYPGQTANGIGPIVEQLRDLGYLSGTLPTNHTKYEKSYVDGVKKAEKALGLKADGFLTEAEQKKILAKKPAAPKPVTSVSAYSYSSYIKVSWTASSNAFWYEVYRDGKKIGTTKYTYYNDYSMTKGEYHKYSVKACKYTRTSKEVSSYSVKVDVPYQIVTAGTLQDYPYTYSGKTVTVENLQIYSSTFVGSDLYVIAKGSDGVIYVKFEKYYSYWDFKFGRGFYGYTTITSFTVKGKASVYLGHACVTAETVNYKYK